MVVENVKRQVSKEMIVRTLKLRVDGHAEGRYGNVEARQERPPHTHRGLKIFKHSEMIIVVQKTWPLIRFASFTSLSFTSLISQSYISALLSSGFISETLLWRKTWLDVSTKQASVASDAAFVQCLRSAHGSHLISIFTHIERDDMGLYQCDMTNCAPDQAMR